MTRAALLPLVLLLACARVEGRGGAMAPEGDRAAAQRIYAVAEERYAAGAYDEAVGLLRHALLQLPPAPEHDRLRHQLVLRMAHTQLRAHASTGHAAPLHDAQQMLERYLVRHEALFGDGEQARAERGEVYELLFLVERRLDPPSDETATAGPDDERAAADATAVATADHVLARLRAAVTVLDRLEALGAEEAPAGPEPAPTPIPVAAAEPAPAHEAGAVEPEPAEAAPARHVDANGHEVREVVVKKIRLASLDDPRVVERLRSEFSTGWAGLVLTKPGIELVHGPRPLVRGTSRLAGPGDRHEHQRARRAGQSLVRGARQPLRDCYAAAFAREPVEVTDSQVEASIHPDGSISHVRIVDGGLVDGHGDACLIEALQAAAVEPLAEAEEPVRVRVALTFFYEEPVFIVESTGEQLGPGDVMLRPNPKADEGLPPIDEFVK